MVARARKPAILFLLFLVLLGAFLVMFSRLAARTDGPSLIDLTLSNARRITDLVTAPVFVIGSEEVDGDALFAFYRKRESRLAWSGNPRADSDARIALAALQQGEDRGLDLSPYHLEALTSSGSTTPHDAAVHDLLMTDAVLRYARDLRIGRTRPDQRGNDVGLPLQPFEAVTALNAALDAGTLSEFLASLTPANAEYLRLESAVPKYRKFAAEGGWPVIRNKEPDPSMLRARLAREDPAAVEASDLTEALRRFQDRNGLEADGKLGPRTLAMLNVSAEERVQQIEANLERWRWLPRPLERRYVMVNAADATLKVVEGDTVLLRSKVIVGTANKPTPILRTTAKEVTVNPPWNIPPSIARNEILPLLRRDPNYLSSHHMVIVNDATGDPYGTRVNWKAVSASAFPYLLQQLPGADNALGRLKLEMPNAFNVYLHDTPGRAAFARPTRNLSHGCIRVQEILPLASLALSGDAASEIERLANTIATGETVRLPLKEPLPVYIMYWTASVDNDGTVQFRPDVYGRDTRLIDALKRVADNSAEFFTGRCERAVG